MHIIYYINYIHNIFLRYLLFLLQLHPCFIEVSLSLAQKMCLLYQVTQSLLKIAYGIVDL